MFNRLIKRLHFIRMIILLFFTCFFFFALPVEDFALTPDQILVIANSYVPEGVAIARYYMRMRHIPSSNLFKIKIEKRERCSRKEYNQKILLPLRRFLVLMDDDEKIKCLVLVYGIPLTITPDKLDENRAKRLGEKKKLLKNLREALKRVKKTKEDRATIDEIKAEIEMLRREVRKIADSDQIASVDSELSLARFHKYRLSMWLPNPYYVGYGKNRAELDAVKDRVLMVSRLDAPDVKSVKRIIDDSIATEIDGLKGIAYFDARYPRVGKSPSMYGRYDLSIRKAAEMVHKSGVMKVVLDITPKLFKPGSCPRAALYCGWYSLAKYVDAFTWVKGAVGYHIASAECVSLHDKNASYWCMKMLEKGVAATLGPVAEPYLRAFPPPDLFFKFLLEGRPLVEAYFLSKPFVSWRMVLVGDPLYRPFRFREIRKTKGKTSAR